jgi:ATP-dependent helicase/nuclease subunit B
VIGDMSQAPEQKGPAIYSVPAGTPFADALADGILAQTGGKPEDLAEFRILLPTRRACRALRDAFLRRSGGLPMLLPRLMPLGDMDEDELAISDAADLGPADFANDIPPAISGLRRRVLLARMVLAMSGGETTPEQAVHLASELGRLLDQVHTEELGFDALASLVPAEFAAHWQITLEFLSILSAQWPKVLAAEGCVDAAQRRNLLLAAQAQAWRRDPPLSPIIAAGSTGSIPATAELLQVIAGLPRGCVVLPGLDTDADDDVRARYEPTHPQFGMARLMERMGIGPQDVAPWPAPNFDASNRSERSRLAFAAMHPASATHRWHDAEPFHAESLSGVSRIDCPGPREEAGVVALVMREVLETDGADAALVTPDRGLARRVASELRRWGIEVDDSAGVPLAQTPTAAFLRLAADMAAEGFAPVPTLAALKHPLAACGQSLGACRAQVRRLEIAALRGARPASGIEGLRAVLGDDVAPFEGFLDALETACAPFFDLVSRPRAEMADLTDALIHMAEALAATDTETGAARLWVGDAGEAAAGFVAELRDSATDLGEINAGHFPGLLDALMAGAVVRPVYGRHPRLHIWGPLEARLQQTGVLILGGLNEGTWPPETHAGPWMSRPMMASFGLPLPERRIGLAAHDFAQAFCAERVVLTRATRVDGTPSVPCRWLLRLETLLESSGIGGALKPDERPLRWFEHLDATGPATPVSAPAPRPPVKDRPRRLSVTRIETWIRDPYAIFARNILKLEPLEAIDADPAAAERGIIVHNALEEFTRAFDDELPTDALDKLLEIGERHFKHATSRPGVLAFWWPRFMRLAAWFVAYETARRAAGYRVMANEADAKLEIGTFTLTGRADRLDRSPDGELAIVDYKTGQAPTWKQVKSGLAPQLSLEAVMAAQGAFEGVDANTVAELIYLRLTGARAPGEAKVLNKEIDDIATDAYEGLVRRIAAFDDPATPYLSRPCPIFARAYGDYDHLARVKEWVSGEGGDE